ncbi:MAG: DUF262 domain-containing protein [Gallionella sp.]|nr:DUF262 domain-containing protein [Gallionella sp.]
MSESQEENTLNLYPIDYPFETLVSRIKSDPAKLILNPEFQRKYKWDKDGWLRASKFIESCLMRIPLPSCYFAEDEERRHLVIDGVQRLTTIRRFFDDEFALEGMTTFKTLEGKKFSEIGEHRAELESTTIRCIVLRKENPKKLIREIFSRLNQGAVELSDQEIRHAIYPGSLDDLLIELGANPIIANFALAQDTERTKDSREAEEQVLRFFVFSDDINLVRYENVLRDYLDEYMENNCLLDITTIDSLRIKFNTALNNCETVFNNDIFTDSTRDRKRQGLVHYDLLMPTIGLLPESIVKSHATQIKSAYNELCVSEEFRKSLSGGLQKKSSIVKRRQLWNERLQKAINE